MTANAGPPPLPGMKRCHRCAEHVLADAKVCRYCHSKLDIGELQTDVSMAAIQAIIAVGGLLAVAYFTWRYYVALDRVIAP